MSTPSQDDLYNVMQALKNGEGTKLTVSDISFGPQNFPVAGSIDDQSLNGFNMWTRRTIHWKISYVFSNWNDILKVDQSLIRGSE